MLYASVLRPDGVSEMGEGGFREQEPVVYRSDRRGMAQRWKLASTEGMQQAESSSARAVSRHEPSDGAADCRIL